GSGASVTATARSAVAAVAMLKAAENSDVLLAGSVAVAEKTLWPAGAAKTSGPKLESPLAFVVTLEKPMNVWPSPLPLGSAVAFEKNSTRKVVPGVLFRVP